MSLITHYITTQDTFDLAQRWVAENVKFAFSKKRGVLYKQVGSKQRIYSRAEYEEWHEWEGQEETPLALPQQIPLPDDTP